ncbi:hypothetical protein T484DRAFT_1756949 [Baffinella frigidus]|nr:hypothetical protein T484DRAFT_1756949 [Cryptophyta sp. CCMP2293]
MVQAATTIQRFYTYKLAADSSRCGLTCKAASNMVFEDVVELMNNDHVVKTIKRLLLRIIVLTAEAPDACAVQEKRPFIVRSFTWAYMAAYHAQLGNSDTEESRHVTATAAKMISVFDAFRRAIVCAPRGANPVHFIEKASSFPQVVSAYRAAVDNYRVGIQRQNIDVCTERFMKLHQLEDGLVTADAVSTRTRRTHKFAPTQQYKLPNLVLLVNKKGIKYESDYMDTAFGQGRRLLCKTYAWLFSDLEHRLSYANCCKTSVECQKQQLTELVYGSDQQDVDNKVSFAIVDLLVPLDRRLSMVELPETLVFDIERIARIHKGYHMQCLIVTLAKALVKFPHIIGRRPFTQFDIIDMILNQIISEGLVVEDVEKMVAICFNVLTDNGPTAETDRKDIRDAIVAALDDRGDTYCQTVTSLRLVAFSSVWYDGNFSTVKDTVESFNMCTIPLEARCLASILHEQGNTVKKMMNVNLRVHAKRYKKIVADVAIALLYAYP